MEKKYYNVGSIEYRMKDVIIICEGRTEQEFCANVLSKFFKSKNINIRATLIKKSGGGIVKWLVLKKQIKMHLFEKNLICVTTLIDYYGLRKKYGFPCWKDGEKEDDKNLRMKILEEGMLSDVVKINYEYKKRYIPYIQLHEFEGLLFNNVEAFSCIDKKINTDKLKSVINEYNNPEMINNNKETLPSERLKKIIKGYSKILHGNEIAKSIGLTKIRNKSPRFNKWIEKIEKICLLR